MDNKNRKSGTGNITRGILPLAAGALGAGFLNGLLGAGAGIVLYFVLAAAGSPGCKGKFGAFFHFGHVFLRHIALFLP